MKVQKFDALYPCMRLQTGEHYKGKGEMALEGQDGEEALDNGERVKCAEDLR